MNIVLLIAVIAVIVAMALLFVTFYLVINNGEGFGPE